MEMRAKTLQQVNIHFSLPHFYIDQKTAELGTLMRPVCIYAIKYIRQIKCVRTGCIQRVNLPQIQIKEVCAFLKQLLEKHKKKY